MLPRVYKQLLHLSHRLFHADHNRAADDAVANIELHDLGDSSYGNYVLVIQSVAGMDFQTQTMGQRGCLNHYLQFKLSPSGCVTVAPGVNLHAVSANFSAYLDMILPRINEKTDPNPGTLKALDRFLNFLSMNGNIQPPFRG
jgi:hypothetical protein